MFNFIAAQYGNISDIEILWTTVALIGFVFSLFNLREAHQDRKVLREAGIRNGRKMIANYSFIGEACRATIQAIFATIGFLAMTIPDAVSQEGLPLNIIILGIVFRWGLVLSGMLITLKSVLAWHLRRELRNTQAQAVFSDEAITTDVTGQITVVPNETDNGSTIVATLEGETEAAPAEK